MLRAEGVPFHYRDYREDPLSVTELRAVIRALGVRPAEVLRKGDGANKTLGLTGDEPDGELLRHMAAAPTLLQRPIGLLGGRAVLGRPPERLLGLMEGTNG